MSKSNSPKKKGAPNKASKPAVKKTVAKAPARPAKKTAAPAKKVPVKSAQKPIKAVSKVKSPPVKKAPAKPLAKKAAPAPAKKAAVKKAPAPVATKAAVKKVLKAPAKKVVPTAKKAAPAPAAKKALAPAPVKKAAAAPAAKPAPTKSVATAAKTNAKISLPPPTPAPPPVALANEVPPPPPAPVVVVPAAKPASKPAAASGKKGAAKNQTPAVPAYQVQNPRTPTLSSLVPTPTSTGALFYDSHMHTPLCKHAWGEPEEYAEQAVRAGMKGIIFTCHCPMPDGFWPTVRMADSEFDTYLSLVNRAKEAYRGKLEVCLGIESEFYPGCEAWIEKLHERADFDYVLGAVHWQAKEYLNKFETGTIENFRRIYFDHLAASAESGLYDCLAHPDLVKNYHPDSWCFAIIKNSVTTALDRIAKTGVAMELNTSGLNKSYSEMNPGNEMLRMMAERQIPIVLGSDSHRAQRVGEHFVTALNNLAEAGYEKVSYFQKRERVDLKISDVLASIKRAADANA